MSVQTKLMTAEELLAMPADGRRHELWNGELVTMSPSGNLHSEIALAIGAHLREYVRARGLGKAFGENAGYVISRDPDTVLAPDASFVRRERFVRTEKYFPGPPDLAVEVISPNDRYTEVDAKVRNYLHAGTAMVIVIDPQKQTASVHTVESSRRLTLDDVLEGANVVPGWRLPLRELFAD